MKTVGIDFGTSTTVIAVREDSSPARLIPLGKTTLWMQSLAAISSNGEIVTGEQAAREPLENQIESAKTLLGKGIDSVEVGGFVVSTTAIVEAILKSAIQVALAKEPDLFSRGTKVYACCPALWTLGPRQALAKAFAGAGVPIDVVDILEEPLAAGIGWIQERLASGDLPEVDRLLVFDAGGGTLDVALLDFGTEDERSKNSLRLGSVDSLFVLSSESLQGAGDELDLTIADFLLSTNPGLSTSGEIDTSLLRAARLLKEDLSSIEVQKTPVGPKKIVVTLDRKSLDKVFADEVKQLVRTSCDATKAAMIRFNRDADPVDLRRSAITDLPKAPQHVLMVGGTSLIPSLQVAVQATFSPAHLHVAANPQEVVASGLTYASELSGLNMPRPPLRLVAEISFPDGGTERRVIQNAFDPLFTSASLLRGETRLGVHRLFEDRDTTVCFFGETTDSSPKSFPLSPDTWHAPVNFKYYATGEVVISDKKKHFQGLIKGWPQLGRTAFDLVPSSPGSWARNEPEWWRFK